MSSNLLSSCNTDSYILVSVVLFYRERSVWEANLYCIKRNITGRDRSHNVNYKSSNIDSKLELNKFLNICIDRTPPSNNLHKVTEVNFRIRNESMSNNHEQMMLIFHSTKKLI